MRSTRLCGYVWDASVSTCTHTSACAYFWTKTDQVFPWGRRWTSWREGGVEAWKKREVMRLRTSCWGANASSPLFVPIGKHWRSIQWAANLELDRGRTCKGSEVEEAQDKSVSLCPEYKPFSRKHGRGRQYMHPGGENEGGGHGLLVFATGSEQCIGLWQFVHLLTTDIIFNLSKSEKGKIEQIHKDVVGKETWKWRDDEGHLAKLYIVERARERKRERCHLRLSGEMAWVRNGPIQTPNG